MGKTRLNCRKYIIYGRAKSTFFFPLIKMLYVLTSIKKIHEHQHDALDRAVAACKVRDENSIFYQTTAFKNLKPNNPQHGIMHKIAKIDKFGRISIPVKMRKTLCLNESTAVYIRQGRRTYHTPNPHQNSQCCKENL